MRAINSPFDWPRLLVFGLSLMAALAYPLTASAQTSPCGALSNAYGPYDYRTDRDKLEIVERFHFTPQVEAAIGLRSAGDHDYTLRAFPNHHRALLSLARYGEITKSPQPRGARYSIECYFDRAVRFRPDDTVARMLYAQYLWKNQKPEQSLAQLAAAEQYAKDNGFTHYNLGLVYLEMKQFDKALKQAHQALALGFERTELKQQLQAAGQWADPGASDAAPAQPGS